MSAGHDIAGGKMLLILRQTTVSAEFNAIAVQDHTVLSGWRHDPIIAVRAVGMKVEHKHESGAFTSDDFIFQVLVNNKGTRCIQKKEGFGQRGHLPVEPRQQVVFKIDVIHQVPLPAGIMIGPVVARSRKIDPFGVTEFVAHEIKITCIGSGHCDQPDDLV